MALNKMEAELHSLQLQIHSHSLCDLLESIQSPHKLGDFFPLFHLARNANC